ncbi:MAG: putative selenate ABC transporter substrate-binding protein [Synechococcales cyanobacterium CRU_2_2]|nr:putative selenate ABC transporter substrate-binding protein [Synechococcales cyanobacterium CRU_2_2]
MRELQILEQWRKPFFAACTALLLITSGCATPSGSDDQGPPSATGSSSPEAKSDQATTPKAGGKALVVGAIPDQDPEKLNRLYGDLSAYLSKELGVPVEYKPVIDYPAAVTAFKVGELDLVWFGGLTGTQARLQVPGAEAIAQRDIDADFHSVFIANKGSGIEPFTDLSGLSALKGRTFTFGSESSTSGRLMPQYFMSQAGVTLADFKGQPGFSDSHDATIKLVEAGSYETGVLNEQVWNSRLEEGAVDESKVQVVFRTPAYFDYHWILHPDAKAEFGNDLPAKLQQAFLKLNPSDPSQAEILELFGAEKFITTENSNYEQIEKVGREIGKIK